MVPLLSQQKHQRRHQLQLRLPSPKGFLITIAQNPALAGFCYCAFQVWTLFHFWNSAALLLFLIRFFIIKKPKKAVNIA